MSSIKCCCKTSYCDNIKENELLFNNLKKEIQTSLELSQYLLSECKTYTENAEYREKLLKLKILRLKVKKSQLEALLLSFEKRNKELEEETYRINEKNKQILSNMECLNKSLSASESYIQSLSDALETTKLELERIRFSIYHKQTYEKKISIIEAEKSVLEKELEQSLKIGMFFKEKWTQSEQLIKILKMYIDKDKLGITEEKDQVLVDKLKNCSEIKTISINSIMSLLTTEKPYLVSFVKELIIKNSLLKKAFMEHCTDLFTTQDKIIYLQQILCQQFNNADSLVNNSFNLYDMVYKLSHEYNSDHLFLKKNNTSNYFLNKNTKIFSKFTKENEQIYSLKPFNKIKGRSEPYSINTSFAQIKFKKLDFNDSKIIRSSSAPSILLSSNSLQSQNVLNNISEKSQYIAQNIMFSSSDSILINNKIRHSCSLDFYKDNLCYKKYNELNSKTPIYSDITCESFFKYAINKKLLYEIKKSSDFHDSFLLKKLWLSFRNFSLPTQFISPIISTFTTVPTESSIFLNNNTRSILTNSFLKSTIIDKHFLTNNSKKKKHSIKLWKNKINNKDKSIWNSIFNKWSRLIHVKYPSTSISADNADLIAVKS
ncbi:uncharacterized protein T551_00863 [Pneumocystis jirovecii RU7]|uniref:Uncharacterized protein n=1 Tax=Pneumocystis jirovecii (strain RU7) TaxID=1408657 RepID=A0A0W4ZUX2_PNEJ7|nr:uncharacterized protein T551_00863 [Pneumocystis jirovecii RU7]KTW32181.1 hypothetical protein T551_00863 [Pneumocystis jirovecii RU7]